MSFYVKKDANFDYSTSWSAKLLNSPRLDYDYTDGLGYFYYWGVDGYLRNEFGEIVDADGNLVVLEDKKNTTQLPKPTPRKAPPKPKKTMLIIGISVATLATMALVYFFLIKKK